MVWPMHHTSGPAGDFRAENAATGRRFGFKAEMLVNIDEITENRERKPAGRAFSPASHDEEGDLPVKTKTSIRSAVLATACALMAISAPLASAQAAEAMQNRPQSHQSDRQDGNRNNDSRYGRWDNSWGARPPAPPRSFTRTADWHRHVRACQQRFRSYNPATDRYTVRRGQTAVCRL